MHHLSLRFCHCIRVGRIGRDNCRRSSVQGAVDNDNRRLVILELIGNIGADGVRVGRAEDNTISALVDSRVDQVHLLCIVRSRCRSDAITINAGTRLKLFQSRRAAVENDRPEVARYFGIQASQIVLLITHRVGLCRFSDIALGGFCHAGRLFFFLLLASYEHHHDHSQRKNEC